MEKLHRDNACFTWLVRRRSRRLFAGAVGSNYSEGFARRRVKETY